MRKSNKLCSVPQCSARCTEQISLHYFPADVKLRKEWVRVLKIGKTVSKYMMVCSLHFKKDCYFLPDYEARRHILKKTAIPSEKLPVGTHCSVLSTVELTRKEQRANRAEARNVAIGTAALNSMSCQCIEEIDSPVAVEDTTSEEMDAAEALLELQSMTNIPFAAPIEIESPQMVDKSVQFDECTFKTTTYNSVLGLIRNAQDLSTMTGLPSFKVLHALAACIKKAAEPIERCALPLLERIVLTLMRLKLDISFRCLSVLFQCSSTTCQNYFHDIIGKLARVLSPLVRWPEKDEILKNMPRCFDKYSKTRVVLDCTEVPTEKTRCLKCRILTYSHYKRRHTIKFLVGVTPSGLVSYVSRGYGGRASDKAIFNQSDLMKKLIPTVDAVMVDKGFLIEKECFENSVHFICPPFLRKKNSFLKRTQKRPYPSLLHVYMWSEQSKELNCLQS